MGVPVRGGEPGDRGVVGDAGAERRHALQNVDTHYMNEHLKFVTSQVAEGSHAILVLDRAGWHVAEGLKVPANLTLLHLPPYSPELNPVERAWAYTRSRYLSDRVFKDYDELSEAVGGRMEPAGAGAAQVHLPHRPDRARGLAGKRITISALSFKAGSFPAGGARLDVAGMRRSQKLINKMRPTATAGAEPGWGVA